MSCPVCDLRDDVICNEKYCSIAGPGTERDLSECRLCWVRLGKKSVPEYRQVNSRICTHRGELTGETHQCSTCTKKVLMVPSYQCDLHEKCTVDKLASGVKCCKLCNDRVFYPFTGPIMRHLIYHLYPVRHSEMWKWNIEQIKSRLHLFNGRKLLTLACDGSTFPPDLVTPHLKEFEVVTVRNDPKLRETIRFHEMLKETFTDNAITFVGHAKGVTHGNQPLFKRWTELLYETNLDYHKLAEARLQSYIFAGSFKKTGHGWGKNETCGKSSWHYSGGMYWIRNSELEKRDWATIPYHPHTTEAYPGLVTPQALGGVMFHENSVPHLNMYDANYLERYVEPSFKRWKEDHQSWRYSS